jgi:hypothetical protein
MKSTSVSQATHIFSQLFFTAGGNSFPAGTLREALEEGRGGRVVELLGGGYEAKG